MEFIIIVWMALGFLIPVSLYLLSIEHLREAIPENTLSPNDARGDSLPSQMPRVSVLVPLTGNAPGMTAYLESLIDQDYPNYELIFITRDLEDPASELVQRVISSRANAHHVLSGPASRCGQKNRNLLAGLAALDESSEILVFCDSTHYASPQLIGDLIRPLMKREAILTTGFHRVSPQDRRMATLGMFWSVLAIQALQAIPLFTLPWGGATAIWRDVFERCRVDRLWAERVVDDMTMGVHLRKHGIRAKSVATACLITPVAGQTVKAWCAWLTRQFMFLKYTQPLMWSASVLICCLVFPSLPLAICAVFGGILGTFSPPLFISGIGYVAAITWLARHVRTLIPQDVSTARLVFALIATKCVALWSYGITWFTDVISWRGIAYRVSWGGRVVEVIHRERS